MPAGWSARPAPPARPNSAQASGQNRGQIQQSISAVEPFGACRSRARPRQIWWSSLVVRFCNGHVARPADPDPRAPARVPPARPCPDPAWHLARIFAARDPGRAQGLSHVGERGRRRDGERPPMRHLRRTGPQTKQRRKHGRIRPPIRPPPSSAVKSGGGLFFGGQERRRSSLFPYPRLFVVRRSRGAAGRRGDAHGSAPSAFDHRHAPPLLTSVMPRRF